MDLNGPANCTALLLEQKSNITGKSSLRAKCRKELVKVRAGTRVRKHASEGSTLALEPRADVTRSPKQGISRPTKSTDVLQNL